MTTSFKAAARVATVASLAAAAALVGGIASAHIPGASNEGVVVITDSNLVQIEVADKGANPTKVEGTITNTSTLPMRCATPGLDKEYPGQVTEAKVVEASMAYYRANIFAPGGFELPMGGGVLTAGSLYDVLPGGSLTGSLLGAPVAGLVDIREMQQAARVAGHTGEPTVGNAAVFDLAAGQALNWTANLEPAASGDRGEWDAAAMFFCSTSSGAPTSYVFAGYEGANTP